MLHVCYMYTCPQHSHALNTHIHVHSILTNSGSHRTIPPSGKVPPTRHPCWSGCFLLHLCACGADPHLSSAVPCVPAGKTLVRKWVEPINGCVVCIHGAINYLDVNYYKICKLLVESTYQLHVAFNFTMFHALPSHSWVLGMLEASCLLLSGLLYIYIILYI